MNVPESIELKEPYATFEDLLNIMKKQKSYLRKANFLSYKGLM